jgi:hypothetical protein
MRREKGERRLKGKVIALGEMQWRDRVGWHAGNRVRKRLRAETRGVYDHTGCDAHGRGAAGSMTSPYRAWRSHRERNTAALGQRN